MEAPEAAGDCQSGFARPGCAVAGIKELAGQAAPQSRAERVRVEAGDSQGSGFTTPAKQRPRRSLGSSAGGPTDSWERTSGPYNWGTEMSV